MRVLSVVITTGAIGLLSGCAPTLNWRDVPMGSTPLLALFPCKPDDAQRSVPLAGVPQSVTMRSCSAGGVTYAIANARLHDPALAAGALAQWRDATLSGLGPRPQSVTLQRPAGSPTLPQSMGLRATGDASRPPVHTLQGLWFALGPEVFAAMVFAPSLASDLTEPFFSGLRLR